MHGVDLKPRPHMPNKFKSAGQTGKGIFKSILLVNILDLRLLIIAYVSSAVQ